MCAVRLSLYLAGVQLIKPNAYRADNKISRRFLMIA